MNTCARVMVSASGIAPLTCRLHRCHGAAGSVKEKGRPESGLFPSKGSKGNSVGQAAYVLIIIVVR